MGPQAKVLDIGGGLGMEVKSILSHTKVKSSNYVMIDRKYGGLLRKKNEFEKGLPNVRKAGGDLYHAPFLQKRIFDVILVRHVAPMMHGLAVNKAGIARISKRLRQVEQRLEKEGISGKEFGFTVTRQLLAMEAISAVLRQYVLRLKKNGCIFINVIPFNQSDFSSLFKMGFKEAIELDQVLRQVKNVSQIALEGMEFVLVRKQ